MDTNDIVVMIVAITAVIIIVLMLYYFNIISINLPTSSTTSTSTSTSTGTSTSGTSTPTNTSTSIGTSGVQVQTIYNFPSPTVDAPSSQYFYNINVPGTITTISVSFSMTPQITKPPGDGVQIILGSNNVQFTGGVYPCRIQGNCPQGVGQPITFNGIIAGVELYYVCNNNNSNNNISSYMYSTPTLFICNSNGQCATASLPTSIDKQSITGVLTVDVTPNHTHVTLATPVGTYTVTASFGISTGTAEISVTTGNNYALWNLNYATISYT